MSPTLAPDRENVIGGRKLSWQQVLVQEFALAKKRKTRPGPKFGLKLAPFIRQLRKRVARSLTYLQFLDLHFPD